MQQIIPFTRPVTAPALDQERIFQYLTIAHLLCAGHALSTPLLTASFVEALRTYRPVGPHQMLQLLPDAVGYFKKRMAQALSSCYFSFPVDETPCRDGIGFVAVVIATAETEYVVHAQKLQRILISFVWAVCRTF